VGQGQQDHDGLLALAGGDEHVGELEAQARVVPLLLELLADDLYRLGVVLLGDEGGDVFGLVATETPQDHARRLRSPVGRVKKMAAGRSAASLRGLGRSAAPRPGRRRW